MSPGVFVEKLAGILGLPSKSIVVIDRALLEAGLRSRGGRGRSAAQVTVVDAATLLLAVMATPVLIHADQAFLPWLRVKSSGHLHPGSDIFGGMFGSRAPVPLLNLMVRLIETPPDNYNDHTLVLEVGVDQHFAILYVKKGGKEIFESVFLEYPDEEVEVGQPEPAPVAQGDMTRYSKVTETTFHELNRLFAPLHDPETRALSPETARRA